MKFTVEEYFWARETASEKWWCRWRHDFFSYFQFIFDFIVWFVITFIDGIFGYRTKVARSELLLNLISYLIVSDKINHRDAFLSAPLIQHPLHFWLFLLRALELQSTKADPFSRWFLIQFLVLNKDCQICLRIW